MHVAILNPGPTYTPQPLMQLSRNSLVNPATNETELGLGRLCSKSYPLFYSQIPILSPIILTNFTHYSHNFTNYSHNFTNYSHNCFIKQFAKGIHNKRISSVIVLIH